MYLKDRMDRLVTRTMIGICAVGVFIIMPLLWAFGVLFLLRLVGANI